MLQVVLGQRVIEKSLVDFIVTGPCDSGSGATINFNHMSLGSTQLDTLNKLMIFGWFKVLP
jgi:hypothetical protein